MRKPYRSIGDERVQEWIYLDRAHLFQFVGKQMVYEGPLKDYEQILIERGYPDRAVVSHEEGKMCVDVFFYTQIFNVYPDSFKLDEYHFVNGNITQSQEGK